MSARSSSIDFSALDERGLNLQAVLAWDALSVEVREMLTSQGVDGTHYSRLLLIGHGGQRLWQVLQASDFCQRSEPVDSYSVDVVQRWFDVACPDVDCEIIYPASGQLVPLQRLGVQAGWHHDSPFRLGINTRWGSWFAYRVVVLFDCDWSPTTPESWGSPCDVCVHKPCIPACPVDALTNVDMLRQCTQYRLLEDSVCAGQCLSRLACPATSEHHYIPEQLHYHYERSLQTIQHWLQEKD